MFAVAWGSSEVVAALVAAVTALLTSVLSTPLRYVIDKRALRHRLRTEYEYEQRKELRGLIGRYHGRMLEAADTWSHRMRNLYIHEADGRFAVDGDYRKPDYYFRTTVHRFLVLLALARRFEAEALFIDARIAERTDLDFLKFARAFRWTMTDLELVAGLDYDAWQGEDHFFTDELRALCDAALVDGEPLSLAEFERRAGVDAALEPALRFFDGLCSIEQRLRWDRLVVLHLLVMGFLNVVGYEIQRSGDAEFARVAGRLRNDAVGANLAAAIPRFGLGLQPEAQRIVAAVAGAPARPPRILRWAKGLGDETPPPAPVP